MSDIWVIEERFNFGKWSMTEITGKYEVYESHEDAKRAIIHISMLDMDLCGFNFRIAKYTRTEPQE